MQLPFVITALTVLTSKGSHGQEIVLASLNSTSPCVDGLRSGIDTYLLTGEVGTNYTELVDEGWFRTVFFEIFTNESPEFLQLCEIFIGKDGYFCGPSSYICYCGHFNAITDVAYVVVNYTARLRHSQGIIKALWLHHNRTSAYSVNNVTLPIIYDVTAAHLKLTISGPVVKPKTGAKCLFHLTLHPSVHLELCCTYMATPCYPQITIGGTVVSVNESPCVTYTATKHDDSAAVALLYSACTETNFMLGRHCAVEASNPQYTSGFVDHGDVADGRTATLIAIALALFLIGCVGTILFEHISFNIDIDRNQSDVSTDARESMQPHETYVFKTYDENTELTTDNEPNTMGPHRKASMQQYIDDPV